MSYLVDAWSLIKQVILIPRWSINLAFWLMTEFPKVVYWGLFLMRNLDSSLTPINCCHWSVSLNCDRKNLSILKPVLGNVTTWRENELKHSSRCRRFSVCLAKDFCLLECCWFVVILWGIQRPRCAKINYKLQRDATVSVLRLFSESFLKQLRHSKSTDLQPVRSDRLPSPIFPDIIIDCQRYQPQRAQLLLTLCETFVVVGTFTLSRYLTRF